MKLLLAIAILLGGYFYMLTSTTDTVLDSVHDMYARYSDVETVTEEWAEGNTAADLY